MLFTCAGLYSRNAQYSGELVRSTLKLAFESTLVLVRIDRINRRVSCNAVGCVVAVTPIDCVKEGIEEAGAAGFARSIRDVIDLVNSHLKA